MGAYGWIGFQNMQEHQILLFSGCMVTIFFLLTFIQNKYHPEIY